MSPRGHETDSSLEERTLGQRSEDRSTETEGAAHVSTRRRLLGVSAGKKVSSTTPLCAFPQLVCLAGVRQTLRPEKPPLSWV